MAHHVRAHHNGTNADILGAKVRDTGQSLEEQLVVARKDNLRKCANPVLKKANSRSPGKAKRKNPKTSIESIPAAIDEKNIIQAMFEADIQAGRCFNEVEAGDGIVDDGNDLDTIFSQFGAQLKAVDLPPYEGDEKVMIMMSHIIDKGKEDMGEVVLKKSAELSMGMEKPAGMGINIERQAGLPMGMERRTELTIGIERGGEIMMEIENVDNGLMFLAAGSDDATDADMESRAHSDACFSTPGSKHVDSPLF